ncbi:MAG: hypothetical protein K6E95_07205 [Lachnospiraceae bacterium]|nr:hypothetical protein [Lachnospiraceae bacterium]
MGERNRFAFDRDYYNRIGAEIVGSSAKKTLKTFDDERDIEEYLTATYAPEYSLPVPKPAERTKESAAPSKRAARYTANAEAVPARREEPARKERPLRKERLVRRERDRKQTESDRKRKALENPRIKTRYLVRLNPVKSLLTIGVIILLVQLSVNLLAAKSDVNCLEKEITNAKITLEDVNSYNESLLGELDISYDRNYIYNVAVGRLGMVYPKDNKVLYYKSADTSHVIQYRDII